jgi:hypothetical protein
MTQDTDSEQRRRIAELEKDVVAMSDVQCIHYIHMPSLSRLMSV